jgi:AraC family transcriptional activator of pobA
MQAGIEVKSLAQFSGGQDWQLLLAQDRPCHCLFWITRGQGRLLIDGQRRGLGTHNAVFIPAHTLFALDLGRQGMAQVVTFPDVSELTLPRTAWQLRIRDTQAMTELNGLLEAALREQTAARPLMSAAMDAHAALIAVWLRRQTALEDHVPPKRNAAQRLSSRFCARVASEFASHLSMAEHAEALDVTPTHLTRACKTATGRTAADLLTERTLFEARKLLGESTVPAQDIARHLGFGSAAYFTRFMQHHTGKTPTALRKSAQSKPVSTPKTPLPAP